MRKAIALFLTCIMLVVFFAGCGGTSGGQSTTAPAGEGVISDVKASLTMWTMPWIEDFQGFWDRDVIPEMKKVLPNVDLEVTILSWDSGPEKIKVAVATDTTPNFLLEATARIIPGGSQGIMADMTDVLDYFKGYMDQAYLDEAARFVSKDGNKPYMVPGAIGQPYLFSVNKTLAEELGVYDLLPKDKVSWTFADFRKFLEACKDAGKDKGVYGSALWAGSRSSDSVYYGLMLSNGATIMNEDNTKFTVDNPQALEVMEFLNGLVKDELVHPGAPTLKDEDVNTLFFNRKIVMTILWSGISAQTMVEEMRETGDIDGDFECEIFGYPYGESVGEQRTVSWGLSGVWAIYDKTSDDDQVKAAKEFIKWYMKREDFANTIHQIYCMPTNSNIKIEFKSKWNEEQYNLAATWGQYGDSTFGILEPFWSDVRETFYPQLQAAYSGNKTPAEALTEFQKNAQKVVDDYLAAQ